MNLLGLRTACLRRLGRDYDATALTELINMAIHQFEVERDWYWLMATGTISAVAGTNAYAVPTDWKRTVQLYHADTVPLDYIDIGSFRERYYGSPAPSGRPSTWAYWNGQILLGATPDTSYSIAHHYFKTEPDLSGDSDTPLMPSRYHPAIVELVLAQEAETDRARSRAERQVEFWRLRMHKEARTHRGFTSTRLRA